MRYINPAQKVAEPLIKRSGVLALDTETRGLTRRSQIVLLIIRTAKDSFLWDTRKGWPTWINKYLADPSVIKVIHNALFDCSLIETQQRVRVRTIRDTMLQEKILLGIEAPFGNKDEKVKAKYSTSLKYSLVRHGLPHKVDFDSRFFATWTGPITVEIAAYAFGDVEQLIKLDEAQRDHERYNQAVFDLENSVVEVFIQMRVNGINFNRERWLNTADDYMDEYKEKKRLFDKMLRKEANLFNDKYKTKIRRGDIRKMPSEINNNSPKQVKELFALRGIVIESYTDFKRQYSMHKEDYKDKLLEMFFDMRNFYQLANTFGEKWLHEDEEGREPTIDRFDGRVHPDFTQIISTGRSSCSNPNLQQLPAYKAKELKGGHPREAFIASLGFTLFSSDYSGQEFALMIVLAQEPKWLEYIAKGYDTHSMLTEMAQPQKWKAATLLDCEFKRSKKKCNCPEHGQLRTYTKKIIFGMPYGKGITSIAEDLAISYEEAAPIAKSIIRVMPRLRRWMEIAKAKALREKAVWTLAPFKRYRKLEFFVAPKSRFSPKGKATSTADYFATKGASKDSWRRKMIADNTDWRVKNQGVNSPIQGSGADMLKQAMVYIQAWIDEHSKLDDWGMPTVLLARILLPVHDAILTECKDKIAAKWKGVIEDCMERAAMLITDGQDIIKAETKSGKSWA